MKASADSAPLCTCHFLSVGASINLYGCLLAEVKALSEGVSEVCASMHTQGIQCWCKQQAEELLQARRAQARWTKKWMQSALI